MLRPLKVDGREFRARYEPIRHDAFAYAFLLMQMGSRMTIFAVPAEITAPGKLFFSLACWPPYTKIVGSLLIRLQDLSLGSRRKTKRNRDWSRGLHVVCAVIEP